MYEDNPLIEEVEQEPISQEVPEDVIPAPSSEQENIPQDQPETEPSVVEESGEETIVAETPAEESVATDAPVEEPISTEAPADAPASEPEAEAPVAEATAEESTPAEGPSALPLAPALPYHERYYLRYREGKRTTALDLEGTRSFLQEIGFDGGELKQAREGKDCAENFRNADKNKNNQMYCSYCGTEISGVEFYRLPDGRMRCTTCSNSIVKTKAEVAELCQRVITNLDSFFGASIDVPVAIEVVDERKLKKKVGVPLGTRDSQSMLILGVAINKRKKYSIILENGAPRLSLIATFAHELTHIWQYTHWDNKKNFPKCAKSKRLLIYEGMAKWAEIQYLYLIGETAVAKREEYITRNRQDEYGIGFCLYEDQYPLSREAMTIEETPFTQDRYPIG